jgi:hypothetical protein
MNFNDAAPIDSNFYLHPEISNSIEPSASYFEKNTTSYLTYSEEYDQKLEIDPRVEYKLNNYAHRCDDFSTLDKEKTNILFAGCSSTFGHSLPEKYIWSKKLYDALPFENKGPFNSIGIPGAGIEKIVSNILKYCNQFGNPDYIFIAHADFTREMLYDSTTDQFLNKIHLDYRENSLEQDKDFYLMFKFQLLYRILEIYCKSHNIKLLSYSWDSVTIDRLIRIFPETFINEHRSLDQYAKIFDYDSIDNDDKDFLVSARDRHHPGIIHQDMVFNLFLSSFNKLTSNTQ